ncbi:MAG: tetratricopeptide repeat protein [Candidatus Acidiferrales bacterium]
MRRYSVCLTVLLLCAASTGAQIGKRVSIRAGTPEDRAVTQITSAADPAEKLALLEKFMAEYGQGEMVLVAYNIYIDHYMQAQDYAKVYEYGEKALAIDPEGFSIANRLFRAAQQQGDAARMFDYGVRTGEILQRYKARPAPEGVEESTWQVTKANILAENQDGIAYVEYTLFSTAYANTDPPVKAAQLERFANAFPDSPYAGNAQVIVAGTYQQMGQLDKMHAYGEQAITAQPTNFAMLVLLADNFSERGVELAKAEQFAGQALKVLETAEKPGSLTDEQWAQHKAMQQGLAHSTLGQVHLHKKRNAQAVESLNAAAPLLKNDAGSYARNQYRLGYAYVNLKRMGDARKAFSEAAAGDTPYRGPAQEMLGKLPAGPPAKRRRP